MLQFNGKITIFVCVCSKFTCQSSHGSEGLADQSIKKPTLVCLNLPNLPLKALILGASTVCWSRAFQRPISLCEKYAGCLLSCYPFISFAVIISILQPARDYLPGRSALPAPVAIGVASYGALGHVPSLDFQLFNFSGHYTKPYKL